MQAKYLTYKLRKLGTTYPQKLYTALAAVAQHAKLQGQLPGNMRYSKARVYTQWDAVYLYGQAKLPNGTYQRYRICVHYGRVTQAYRTMYLPLS